MKTITATLAATTIAAAAVAAALTAAPAAAECFDADWAQVPCPTDEVPLSELHLPDALPQCTVEDCSDQPGQVGMWLDRDTGEELWRRARNEPTGWATPLVVEHGGKTQVIKLANTAQNLDVECVGETQCAAGLG